ncbi:hypothetical protein CJF31_00004725 [Rutstroemia sp. NJR-2017a BVV2]|nr:hypothetical protein CJF31_00004725 [Rutstroemia sp. NJR-2017a BVV2]
MILLSVPRTSGTPYFPTMALSVGTFPTLPLPPSDLHSLLSTNSIVFMLSGKHTTTPSTHLNHVILTPATQICHRTLHRLISDIVSI